MRGHKYITNILAYVYYTHFNYRLFELAVSFFKVLVLHGTTLDVHIKVWTMCLRGNTRNTSTLQVHYKYTTSTQQVHYKYTTSTLGTPTCWIRPVSFYHGEYRTSFLLLSYVCYTLYDLFLLVIWDNVATNSDKSDVKKHWCKERMMSGNLDVKKYLCKEILMLRNIDVE